jgi:hypothetical protein
MNPLTALVFAGLAVTTFFAVTPQDPATAQRPPVAIPNPQIDYTGFLDLAQATEARRASRRLRTANHTARQQRRRGREAAIGPK